MQIRLAIFLFLAICGNAAAQKHMLDGYRHTINFPDHKVTFQLQEGNEGLKSSDPTKRYHWYSSNQIKITQGGYSGKLLNGMYEDYYSHQNLKEKGQFKLGLKIGEWKTWNEKGILITRINYRKGVLSGPFIKYDTLGNVAEWGRYKDGWLEGKVRQNNAQQVQVLRFRKGVLQENKNNSSWVNKLLFWKPRKKTNG